MVEQLGSVLTDFPIPEDLVEALAILRGASMTDPAMLEACFRNSRRCAAPQRLESVAFPEIGVDVYRWEEAGDEVKVPLS